MSLTVIILLAVTAGCVSAQNISSNAKCGSTYDWMSNSMKQSPCLVSAYLWAPCFGGVYTVPSIYPGSNYKVPAGHAKDTCTCSTVTYSVVAACALCQGALAGNWSIWSANCYKPSLNTYTNTIPNGTAVPPWAYFNVTLGNTLNITAVELEAEAEGFRDVPGLTPSTIITTATVTSTSIPSTTSASSTLTTSAPSAASKSTSSSEDVSQKPSHMGAIAGGAAGAFVALGVILSVITVCLSRRHRNQWAPFSEHSIHDAKSVDFPPQSPSIPPMTQENHDSNYGAPPSLYDPSDPNTYLTSSTPVAVNSRLAPRGPRAQSGS